MIHIVENFLSEEEIQRYNYIARSADLIWHENDSEIWSNRTISLFDVDIHAYNLLSRLESEIITRGEKIVYCDIITLVRWGEHNYQAPHADGEEPDGSMHPYPWRASGYGCMIYLNDDFGAGEIYFPNQNIVMKPVPGRLVFFPGTLEFLHGVNAPTGGTRYTIASFWTEEYNKRLRQYYNS